MKIIIKNILWSSKINYKVSNITIYEGKAGYGKMKGEIPYV